MNTSDGNFLTFNGMKSVRSKSRVWLVPSLPGRSAQQWWDRFLRNRWTAASSSFQVVLGLTSSCLPHFLDTKMDHRILEQSLSWYNIFLLVFSVSYHWHSFSTKRRIKKGDRVSKNEREKRLNLLNLRNVWKQKARLTIIVIVPAFFTFQFLPRNVTRGSSACTKNANSNYCH